MPTVTTELPASFTAESTLSAARALAPEIADRASEIERLGTLPLDLVQRLAGAGLFRMLQPRGIGGAELEPASFVAVLEEIARADASTGWTLMIGAGATAFTAWLDPDVARAVLPNSNMPGAALFAPTARAVAEGGEYSVSGRWPFASGCRHAEWFLNGVIVVERDRPRALPSGAPDWRMAFLQRADIQLIDNWDVMGLRGTGSNDVAGANIRVPEELLIRPFFESARHDGALGRLPFFTLAGALFAGFPLGVGRRALDEFTHLARARGRAGNQNETIGDDGAAQMALARAEGALRSARAFVFDALGSVWRTACLGDEPTLDQRAELQLAVHQAMRAALEGTDMALSFTGASGIRSSHPLQRCFRDLHTANEHMYWSSASIKRYARLRLGLPEATYWV